MCGDPRESSKALVLRMLVARRLTLSRQAVCARTRTESARVLVASYVQQQEIRVLIELSTTSPFFYQLMYLIVINLIYLNIILHGSG